LLPQRAAGGGAKEAVAGGDSPPRRWVGAGRRDDVKPVKESLTF
jgi:hypothetical protein